FTLCFSIQPRLIHPYRHTHNHSRTAVCLRKRAPLRSGISPRPTGKGDGNCHEGCLLCMFVNIMGGMCKRCKYGKCIVMGTLVSLVVGLYISIMQCIMLALGLM